MLLIEKLLISPYFLLTIFFSVIFIGWLFAIKIFTPSDKFWRISNFICLSFSCLGIFGIIKDSRYIFYEREYYNTQNKIKCVYEWRLLSKLNKDLFDIEFIETNYSPNNLNDIQKDYYTTYKWINKNNTYISYCYYNYNQIILDSICYPNLQTTDPVLEYYFNDVKQCIIDYNNDIVKLKEYKEGLRYTTFELFYIIFSPFFLAISLGWEFVKLFAKK